MTPIKENRKGKQKDSIHYIQQEKKELHRRETIDSMSNIIQLGLKLDDKITY